jgi:hypothetical protein
MQVSMPVEEVKQLGKDNICELHMKENGFLLGEGTLDWKKISDVLYQMDYKGDGWMQIEWAMPKDADVVQAYKHNLQFLQTLLIKPDFKLSFYSTCCMRNKAKLLVIIFISFIFIQCNNNEHKAVAKKEVDLYLPDDLEATLWAETPMLYNPTNMDVDFRGRIWVTEAVNYRNYNNDSTQFFHHPKGDRVMILEDTDKDGKADTAKVFVQDEDLLSPVGIAVLGNKVIVSCSPNLIVYTDENGDDLPDKKKYCLRALAAKTTTILYTPCMPGPMANGISM